MVILLILVLAIPAAIQGGPVRIETAEALSQILERMDPEVRADSHAFVLRANSLARVDRMSEAIGELKRAIQLRETVAGQADADTADGYFALGMLQQRMGMRKTPMRHFRRRYACTRQR